MDRRDIRCGLTLTLSLPLLTIVFVGGCDNAFLQEAPILQLSGVDSLVYCLLVITNVSCSPHVLARENSKAARLCEANERRALHLTWKTFKVHWAQVPRAGWQARYLALRGLDAWHDRGLP